MNLAIRRCPALRCGMGEPSPPRSSKAPGDQTLRKLSGMGEFHGHPTGYVRHVPLCAPTPVHRLPLSSAHAAPDSYKFTSAASLCLHPRQPDPSTKVGGVSSTAKSLSHFLSLAPPTTTTPTPIGPEARVKDQIRRANCCPWCPDDTNAEAGRAAHKTHRRVLSLPLGRPTPSRGSVDMLRTMGDCFHDPMWRCERTNHAGSCATMAEARHAKLLAEPVQGEDVLLVLEEEACVSAQAMELTHQELPRAMRL